MWKVRNQSAKARLRHFPDQIQILKLTIVYHRTAEGGVGGGEREEIDVI